jgi:hypothetical protein
MVSLPVVVCGRLPLGEAAKFVGSGLDQIGSIGAGAELFVLKISTRR